MNKVLASLLCGVALGVTTLSANALTIGVDIGINGSSSVNGNTLTLTSQDIESGEIDGNNLTSGWTASFAPVVIPLGVGASVSSLWSVTDSNTTYTFSLDSTDAFSDSGVTGRMRHILFSGEGTVTDGSGGSTDAYFSLSADLRLDGGIWKGTNSTLTFSAVPIPAAGWLFGSAMIGVAAMARRKTSRGVSESLAA